MTNLPIVDTFFIKHISYICFIFILPLLNPTPLRENWLSIKILFYPNKDAPSHQSRQETSRAGELPPCLSDDRGRSVVLFLSGAWPSCSPHHLWTLTARITVRWMVSFGLWGGGLFYLSGCQGLMKAVPSMISCIHFFSTLFWKYDWCLTNQSLVAKCLDRQKIDSLIQNVSSF